MNLRALLSGPIARGAIESLIIRLASMGVAFVQAVLAARLLGADGLGITSVALSVVMVAATLGNLGTEAMAVRDLARLDTGCRQGEMRGLVRTILGTTTAVSAGLSLALLASAFLVPALSERMRATLAIAALAVPLFNGLAVARGVSRGLGRVVLSLAPGDLLRPALMACALAAFWAFTWPLKPEGYMWLAVLSAMAACTYALILMSSMLPPTADHPESAPHWLREAMPFLGLTLVALLLAQVNTLMLGLLSTPEETGIFQPIARLTPLLTLFISAMYMRYGPRLSALWASGEIDRLTRITRLVTLSGAASTLVLSLGLLVSGTWILGLFGPEFVVAYSALAWVALAQLVNAACGPVGLLLAMTGRAKTANLPQLAGLSVNVLLGLWLIPQTGALGAAQAMAAGIVTWNIYSWWLARSWVGFDPSLLGVFQHGIRGESGS